MLRMLAGLAAALFFGVVGAGTLPAGELSGGDADVARRALQCDELLVIQQHPVMPSHVYTYHVEGLRPGGGLYRYRLPQNGSPGTLTQLVNSSEGVILDCELSPDAKTVLFSWKQSMQEPFHLFTIPRRGRPAAAAHLRRPPQLQRLLAARRRHRLPLDPQPAVRLLLELARGRAPSHGRRRRRRAADQRQLPERLHPHGDGRRPHHLRPLGVRGSAGDPHPETVDHPSRRHDVVRLLRQSRARPGDFHRGPCDPRRLGPRALHDDRAQRPVQRRDRDHRPQERRQRAGGHHQRHAGGGHRQGDDQQQRPVAAAPIKALGRWTIAISS